MSRSVGKIVKLQESEKASVYYHSIFDYPLSDIDLKKWKATGKIGSQWNVYKFKKYYYAQGKFMTINKREKREFISKTKIEIAKRAASLLERIPSVLFVGVTGSVAMHNADKSSDVDLMIITQKGTLWTTRFISWMLFKIAKISVRSYSNRVEKDKICTNIWLDENNIKWQEKNIFTAHEIAQVIPLINKKETYEKFMKENIWIKKYWQVKKTKNLWEKINNNGQEVLILRFFEPFAYFLQRIYMFGKITNEKVSFGKAIFHTKDLSNIVDKKFQRFTR